MIKKPNYTSAIQAINADAEFKISDNDLSTLEWLNGTPAISDADIETKLTELNTQYANEQYKRDRKSAYPSIQEQLDMQYWDSVNGTTTWADAIAAIKEQYPKPE